jgi:hypothetical protein
MIDIIATYFTETPPQMIIDIGTADCLHTIELYNQFPTANIYVLDCSPGSLELCKKNIENYTDRITIIESVFQYNGTIDLCYVNNLGSSDIMNKISTRQIRLIYNDKGILYNNHSNLEMYCIFHKDFQIREDNFYFTFYGVNEIYPKVRDKNVILEYELKKYNPFLQKRGYMETSAYLHVYWNHLYKNKEMVGFSQFDMIHTRKYDVLDKNGIYIYTMGEDIVNKQIWNRLMFPNIRNLNFLIKSYNAYFKTNYSMRELENKPLSLWQTNIYPIKIYEKLCGWLEKLVDEIYPWSNELPYESHFGSVGGYTERALAIFNAFEIHEGVPYYKLNIKHINTMVQKEQYNIKSFINHFSKEVHTIYIANITGVYSNVAYCMFKSQCVMNGITYSCERIYKNKKNGLYFSRDDTDKHQENGFTIEAEDPRIFILNDEVYVIFICLSPYEKQKRCIGITKFNEWNPKFLQIENITKNVIEKNWAPFVKDNKLYFVYNYDPLVILHYDFNPQGLCNVVFKQNNISLPINTANTYLRGGSNLIHYKDHYFIGGCHSRIYKKCFEHYTHIVLLNTNEWKLEYVSKPVMYLCELKEKYNSWWASPGTSKPLDTFNNILMDKTPNIIQDPISLYEKEGKYYITINVRDCVSLLYEISFANLFDFIKKDRPLGYFDNYVKSVIL